MLMEHDDRTEMNTYLESNSNFPEINYGCIYLCFECSSGALKGMKDAASKRRKKSCV